MTAQQEHPVRVLDGNPRDSRDRMILNIHSRAVDEIDMRMLDKMQPAEARKSVERLVNDIVIEVAPSIAGITKAEVAQAVVDEIVGYGPIQPLLDDPEISEIMVNSPDEVYYERLGILYASPVRFRDRDHIRRIADRIVGPLGRRLDESSPFVDARLPDGSRVNIVIPPISVHSPSITIRKFQTDRFDMDDLIRIGSMSEHVAGFLRAAVISKVNIVVSGGTGSGKTTLLNALSGFIPPNERIVTIEDPIELQLRQPHKVSLEARPRTGESDSEVTQRDLVRNSLRMRPDRIIIGEVRGSEAFDMLQAMNTGHEGSITTVHANTPRDALSRIENMVMMAGFELPTLAIREQMSSALHLIIQISRMVDGSRKVVSVAEVAGMEGDIISLQDIFRFNEQQLGADGRVVGEIRPTGIRPRFADRFPRYGVSAAWTALPDRTALR